MCSPSRSSFLSGWRPERTDVWNNLTPVGQHLEGARPLQAHFRAHGYFTAPHRQDLRRRDVGRTFDWDIDDERRSRPACGSARPRREASDGRSAKTGRVRRAGIATDNDDAARAGRSARAAVVARLIEEHKDGPFFLALGFSKPHLRWVAPKQYFDLYPPDRDRSCPEAPPDDLEDIPAIAIKNRPQERPGVPLAGREPPGMIDDPKFRREAIAAYHACVSFVDAQVGVLLDTLDRLEALGPHGRRPARRPRLPPRRAPRASGARTRCSRRRCARRSSSRRPRCSGRERRPGAGGAARSLSDHRRSGRAAARRRASTGTSLAPHRRSGRSASATGALSFRKAKAPPLGVSVRTDRYRYTEWPDGSEELYDHATDPGETRNLVADPKAAEALAEMRRLRARGPSSPPRRLPRRRARRRARRRRRPRPGARPQPKTVRDPAPGSACSKLIKNLTEREVMCERLM